MMMMMKREREVDSTTMANYLMLLSRGSGILQASSSSRVFECKTCNRQFSSFQALGGHRASHKKPRLMADGSSEEEQLHLLHGSSSPPKPKTHECSICGLEFAIGQALGGHMRRHRATPLTTASNTNTNTNTNTTATTTTTSFDNHNSSSSQNDDGNNNKKPTTSNKRKRSSSSSPSSSSVLFLDLNLTPFENDLEFLKIGQPTTTCTLVDCFN